MNRPLKLFGGFFVLLATFGFGWFLAVIGTGQAADPAVIDGSRA
jgi:hypothetical protein